MHSFKDSEGRDWAVRIDVTAAKRVKAATGVNFYTLVDGKLQGLAELLADPSALVDVLYVLCAEEVGKRSLSDADFGRGFGGDVIEAAADAFLEELIDFFPQARRGPLRTVLGKGKEVARLMTAQAETELERLTPEAILQKLLTSNALSGNAPASSASTPDPGPSANS